MKIQKFIARRVAKFCKIKPNITTPFYQNGYEHVTNTYYAVRIPIIGEQATPDRPETPIMNALYDKHESKESGMRFTTEYLHDALSILKDNGALFVDIYKGERALVLKGYNGFKGEVNTGDAVIMQVAK